MMYSTHLTVNTGKQFFLCVEAEVLILYKITTEPVDQASENSSLLILLSQHRVLLLLYHPQLPTLTIS